MDITTVLGLLIGFGGILLGNLVEGGHVASLVQGAAFTIVFFGTVGAVLVSSKKSDFLLGLKLCKTVFKESSETQAQLLLRQIIDFVRLAKKESLLAVEPRIAGVNDIFLKEILRAVVDGVEPETIRTVFENQIDTEEHKLLAGAKIWSDAAGFSPTIGIIGAVLGLIHIMGNLTDTSKLGAGIATAFVATIYGISFANLLFLPMSHKIKRKIADEIKTKSMVLEGAISLAQGLAPHLVEVKLQSYLEKTHE